MRRGSDPVILPESRTNAQDDLRVIGKQFQYLRRWSPGGSILRVGKAQQAQICYAVQPISSSDPKSNQAHEASKTFASAIISAASGKLSPASMRLNWVREM